MTRKSPEQIAAHVKDLKNRIIGLEVLLDRNSPLDFSRNSIERLVLSGKVVLGYVAKLEMFFPQTADGVQVLPDMDMSGFVFVDMDGEVCDFYESQGTKPPYFNLSHGDERICQPHDWSRIYSNRAAVPSNGKAAT